MESIVSALVEFFSKTLPAELTVFCVSILPLIELRGGIIAAKILDMPWLQAYIICVLANIIPVPFILLFIRKIFGALKKTKPFKKTIDKLEIRAMRKSGKVKKYRELGLFLFVAIPIPGTGAWMGSLIAALFDLRIRRTLPTIIAGILVAGLIMTLLMYGIVGSIFGS